MKIAFYSEVMSKLKFGKLICRRETSALSRALLALSSLANGILVSVFQTWTRGPVLY